jgi:hypothetical protein
LVTGITTPGVSERSRQETSELRICPRTMLRCWRPSQIASLPSRFRAFAPASHFPLPFLGAILARRMELSVSLSALLRRSKEFSELNRRVAGGSHRNVQAA